jgi:hypothetical protein
MKLKLSFLVLFTLIVNIFSANATIRFVSKTGSSIPPYTSWETASDSIQKCINICSFGDTVYVGNGVYKEKLVMIPGLALIGSGIDSCIIDTRTLATQQSFYSVDMKDYCSVEGFYIIVSNGFNGLMGNGIHLFASISDSVHLQGSIKYNKISSAAWGLNIRWASVNIYDNIISNTEHGVSTIAFIESAYDTIYNNYIADIRYRGILASANARIIAYNNTIICGTGIAFGIDFANLEGSEVFNNLIILANYGITSNPLSKKITNNVVINYTDGMRLQQNDIAKNNIVINGYRGFYPFTSGFTLKYNNAWNNTYNYDGFTPDSTNLSADPMFVNQDSMNFHLQMFSPMIDAGDPDILDKDGSRSDIGLYGGPFGEITEYRDLAPKAPKGLSVTTDSTHFFLSWKQNTEADFKKYYIYYDSIPGFSADSSTLLSETEYTSYIHTLPLSYNRIYYKLRAQDRQGNFSKASDEVGVVLVSNSEKPEIVQEFNLYQNYPNPFNPVTKIPFRLKERGYVKLNVYDIKGELVSVLVNEERQAGYYEVEFSPGDREYQNLASGIYIYQIDVKNSSRIPLFRNIKKMIFLK